MDHRDRDAVSWFLNQAGRIPLLTVEEELLLGRAVQDWMEIKDVEDPTPAQRRTIRRGERAYKRMFTANLRLVVNVSKRFMPRCRTLDLSDLVQEGSIGLARAIDKFDPTRGYKFSTYAYWWIRQGVVRAINQQDRMIRLPVNAVDMLLKVRYWAPQFKQEHGRSPTVEECAEHCGVSTHIMRSYLSHAEEMRSLDERCNTSEESSTIIEMLADTRMGPAEWLEQESVAGSVVEAYHRLEIKEQEVIQLSFGFDVDAPFTNADIGRRYGISRERVRQLRTNSVRKMRHHVVGAAA